jgi:anaerobic dimethyl sulfoxide reductase subunit C (anchor subunit)
MEIQWMLALYSLFMGLAIGPFALIAMTDACERRPGLCKWAAIVGLACIVLAGVFAFLHLEQPMAAVYVFANMASPIAQETVFVLLTGVVAALLAGSYLFNVAEGVRKPLAWIGLALAVVSVFFVAEIYRLPARPAWDTLMLPLTMLLSALVNGVLLALVLLALAPKPAAEGSRAEPVSRLSGWALPLLVVFALAALIFFPAAAASGSGMARLLTGDLAMLFWIGLVVVGLLLPALLIWSARKTGLTGFSAVLAFVFVVIGGLVIRAMVFPLGLRVPLEGLW